MTDDVSAAPAEDTRIAAVERDLESIQTRLNRVTSKEIPLLVAALRRMCGVEIDDMAELPAVAGDLQEQLVTLEARLESVEARLERFSDVDTEPTGKEAKIVAVLAYADNKRNGDQSTVAVSASEIKGCAGVSRRYAYDLVEAIAEEVDGCRLREPRAVQTSTGTKHKAKAVLVDCAAVHTEDGAVNSFTTGSGTEPVTGGGEMDAEVRK